MLIYRTDRTLSTESKFTRTFRRKGIFRTDTFCSRKLFVGYKFMTSAQ